MSLLTKNSQPAERAVGCVFAENFVSQADVELNGGTVTSDPTIDFGATFDGTNDYITYALEGNEFDSAEISFVIEFTPDFAYNEDTIRNIFGTSNYYILKRNNINDNELRLVLGGTVIADIAEGTYSSYWKVNERNVLVVSGTTGNTSVWLNGNNILDEDDTAWTQNSDTTLNIGASSGGAGFFDGKMNSFKIFKSLLTAQDALNFYNNSTYNYRNKAILDFPMGMAQHDPTNVRCLDVSGNGKHAQFGDGSTPTTYPTKLSKRGYSGAGDYMITDSGIVSSTPATITMVIVTRGSSLTTDQMPFGFEANGGADIGGLFQFKDDEMIFYCGSAGATASSKTAINFASLNVSVGVNDGTNTNVYVNGTKGANATSPIATNASSDSYASIFNRQGSISGGLAGDMLCCIVFDFGLTPLQIQDLTINLMKQINDV